MANNRNHTIDVMRAFLSWVVVVVHVLWMAGIQGETDQQMGASAVAGFIILSGFVITQLLVTKRETYGVFVFRRFMRLFPAFAICLAFALLIRPLTVGTIQSATNPLIEASENQFFWWHLATHACLMHGLIPAIWLPRGEFAFLIPGWSISLEFQLYLVAPLLLWWLARSGAKGLLLVLMPSALLILPPIASKVAMIWSASGAFLPQRFIFFLIGALIYFFSTGGPYRPAMYRYWPGLVRLGEVSYSTYLVHYPVLALVNRFVPVHWSTIEKVAVLFTLGAPIILVSSFLLYRYVEQPGIKLGRYLSRDVKNLRLSPNSQALPGESLIHS
jgi:peptidoglycan/LPS O-acetylase OafA/YrhL